MFRMWGKIFNNNHLMKDIVVENDDQSINRTKKVFTSLSKICHEFDLAEPIWLDVTISDFKRHSKTRFYQDNFPETVDFDYLEIHVIEE